MISGPPRRRGFCALRRTARAGNRNRPMWLWVYRLLFLPGLLLTAPAQLRRMMRRGGMREGWGERFGYWPELPAKRAGRPRVWVQAVSVGEVLAVENLLAGLAAAGAEVVLSTTTNTGKAVARERYAGRYLMIGYFPVDWVGFVRRAWRRIDPDVMVLVEGERWPECIAEARRRGVPVVAVNARLSDRSFRRMQTLRAMVVPLMRGVTHILPVSAADAARFRELGLGGVVAAPTGNVKLDRAVAEIDEAARAEWRVALGLGREDLILLGASTWPGEEAALVAAWREARAAEIGVRLLLVPRHAERRKEIETLLREEGCSHHFRSRGMAAGEVEVAVADTTGELAQLTRLAAVVFIGKSLPPHGQGQTPVEAAALGRALVWGGEMSNFRVIAQELLAAGAARRVEAAELSAVVGELLRDAAARAAMGQAGRAWQAANRGAVERTLAALRAVLAEVGR